MKCQMCKKKDATVHLTEIEGKEKREVHLCEDCAKEKTGGLPKQISLGDLFMSLIQQQGKENMKLLQQTCPNCGMSYLEFKTGGRLGCAKDYEVFKEGLAPLIERLHRGTQHVGKTPSRAGKNVARENELLRLRRELDRAVQNENYEKAAELRDRIHTLTGIIHGNQKTDNASR